MKNVNVCVLIFAAAFASSSIAEPLKRIATQSVGAELPTRIVIKQKDTVYAQSQSLAAYGQVVEQGSGYKSLVVPKNEAQSILSQLKLREDIESAEMDYMVSIPKPIKVDAQMSMMKGYQVDSEASYFPPNDPYYGDQSYLHQQTQSSPGHSSIELGYVISEKKTKMVVAVLDGGFVNATDMDYAGGYNFSRLGGSRNGDYLKDSSGCGNLHGTAVAGIIGAIRDNGYGMSGIVDADIYAGRVLACDSGYLSDAADGIRWAAGDPNVVGTPLPRVADVINLSLTGETGGCPSYMQSAINYAVSKGSTVVVAAGNDNKDASAYSPANCANVINVGAVSRFGSKAYFSNFGASIDVAAMGMGVLTLQGTDDTSYWNGTSFSSPITAGVAALLKQHYPTLTPAQVESLLKSTAGEFSSPLTNMGQGIVNAEKMMNKAHEMYGDQVASINHAMKEGERCQTGFYTSLFDDGENGLSKLCQLYEVDASSFYGVEDQFYAVFSVPFGQSLFISNPNASLQAVSQDAKFLLPNVDAQQFQYGLQICDASGRNCKSNMLYDLKAENVGSPAFCANP